MRCRLGAALFLLAVAVLVLRQWVPGSDPVQASQEGTPQSTGAGKTQWLGVSSCAAANCPSDDRGV